MAPDWKTHPGPRAGCPASALWNSLTLSCDGHREGKTQQSQDADVPSHQAQHRPSPGSRDGASTVYRADSGKGQCEARDCIASSHSGPGHKGLLPYETPESLTAIPAWPLAILGACPSDRQGNSSEKAEIFPGPSLVERDAQYRTGLETRTEPLLPKASRALAWL